MGNNQSCNQSNTGGGGNNNQGCSVSSSDIGSIVGVLVAVIAALVWYFFYYKRKSQPDDISAERTPLLSSFQVSTGRLDDGIRASRVSDDDVSMLETMGFPRAAAAAALRDAGDLQGAIDLLTSVFVPPLCFKRCGGCDITTCFSFSLQAPYRHILAVPRCKSFTRWC